MRKIDKEKPLIGKAAKTVNFEKVTLMAIERKAQIEGRTCNDIINQVMRQIVLSDKAYIKSMIRHHQIKLMEYTAMLDSLEAQQEVRQ